jgi:hypothetical protein
VVTIALVSPFDLAHIFLAVSHGDSTHIPTALRNKVEMELRSGERIIWTAQPIPKRFSRGGWLISIFGIPFFTFSVFWMTMAGKMSGSAPGPFRFFQLFGVPFVLVGLGMLTAPIWMRRKAARTVYLITDQRAVILSEGLGGRTRIDSYAPEQLQSLTREQFSDGSGDIIFITRTWRDSDGDRRTQRLGFIGVPDVKAVEEHIRALAEKAPRPAP